VLPVNDDGNRVVHPAGNFNGPVSGSFQYTIRGAEGNVLSLNGTVQNGQITGTWTLTGAIGCSGNGNFTMIPAA